MSFWKFGFVPAATNSIDSLLNALPVHPALASTSESSSNSNANDSSTFETTLDALFETPELLSEIKSGSNQPLTDFLASEEVVKRLGGWVVWGLGREQEEVTNGGIVADDVEDGKVPESVVQPPAKKRPGMGNIPRRRDMDEMGVLEGEEPESEQEKKWSLYPRLATEILASDSPSLTNILFNPTAACTQPATCPTASDFLVPFWESVLRSTELQLETRAVQVGYWARVNAIMLSGPKQSETLATILNIPHLISRLLLLLPFCSPINDLILLMLRISKSPSPLIPTVVTKILRMLDPFSALGVDDHIAAEELLRGVIELCSASPIPSTNSQLLGASGLAQDQLEVLEWRDSTLARTIADEKSIKMLLEWMLSGTEAGKGESTYLNTPKPVPIGLPDALNASQSSLRTSSLIQSIAVLVELIRKNNSDFVEQHMLAWARRKEAEALEKEALEADTPELEDSVTSDGRLQVDNDKGPSLVDLSAMLRCLAGRLGGFQELLKKPRSSIEPKPSSAGTFAPLTLERFRICEFYAELLHCSNMSLPNRAERPDSFFDNDGHLAQGWRGGDDLAAALAGLGPEDPPTSPIFRSNYTSPIDVPISSSGLSSPSGHGSLDSESGILTRAEANELRDLVAAASTEDEEGQFESQHSSSDDENAEATSKISLDNDLQAKELDSSPLHEESVLPTLPNHATDEARKSMDSNSLPPGQLLKEKFLEHRVVETMLDLFFEYPLNNFLHNVVFDILQQIFHGRLDRPLDRQLALSVFLDGKLIDRVLAGQAANDAKSEYKQGLRLGNMGHMILIADEITKLFEQYPQEIYAVIERHIPQPAWDEYITTTLRETRARDMSPLAGGVSALPNNPSLSSGTLSDDDEFPVSTSRVMKAREMGGHAGGGSPTDEGAFGGHGKLSSSFENTEAASSDQFSRYLADAISGDRADNFASSDEDDDEDDAGWLGGGQFEGAEHEFAMAQQKTVAMSPKKFGLDGRFESTGRQTFRADSPDSEEDAEWGPFASELSPNKAGTSAGDVFRPTIASSSLASQYQPHFSDDFASSEPAGSGMAGEGQDDFGDFETASSSVPSITIPSMEALNDFDFDEDSRPKFMAGSSNLATSTGAHFGTRPAFGRSTTAEDGSALFGDLSSFDGPSSPVATRSSSSSSFSSPPRSPTSTQANLATSFSQPLGPSMHEGTHLTQDGFVEAEVDGRIIKVPADDIILAHRRLSQEGARPVIDHEL